MNKGNEATVEVAALVRKRRQYLRWQEQVWSLPGEPVVGIVSATLADYWYQLAKHIASFDAQIADIHEALSMTAADSGAASYLSPAAVSA
jgi:hypothetical protein